MDGRRAGRPIAGPPQRATPPGARDARRSVGHGRGPRPRLPPILVAASLGIRWLVPRPLPRRPQRCGSRWSLLTLVRTPVPSDEIDRLARTEPSMAPPGPRRRPRDYPRHSAASGGERAAPARARETVDKKWTRVQYRRPGAERSSRLAATGRNRRSGRRIEPAKQEGRSRPRPSSSLLPSSMRRQARERPRRPGGRCIAGFRTRQTLLTEIVSPDAAFRWRGGCRGFVHLSPDRGATWTLRSGMTVDLAAGASPARTSAGWSVAAGRYCSPPTARTWQRVPFPEAIDLVAVGRPSAHGDRHDRRRARVLHDRRRRDLDPARPARNLARLRSNG